MNILYMGLGYFRMDSYYLLLVLPAMLVALWAQYRVKSAFNKYKTVSVSRGLTGYDAARMILDAGGASNVKIERVSGNLTDHYDPRKQIIRLSDEVYASSSVAAVGVAAHEAGHAVQYAEEYVPIKLRSVLVPVTNIGSSLSMPLILIGMFAGIEALTFAGIALFSLVTLFQLITLPVEYDASRRAVDALAGSGVMTESELTGSRKVLGAAALTYVASLLVSFMNLLRLFLLLGGGRNSRR